MRGLGIRAALRVPDSRFEVLGLNIEDTVTIEFARFFPLVGLNSGEKFQLRNCSGWLIPAFRLEDSYTARYPRAFSAKRASEFAI
jgi:hypothetical protein